MRGFIIRVVDQTGKFVSCTPDIFRQLFFTLILYAKACDVLTPKAYLKDYQTVKLWPQARVVYLIQHGRESSVNGL